MLSYEVYKFMHLVGLALLVFCLGAICLQMLNGKSRDFQNRKILMIGHGVGLALMLIAGFGMMARLGLTAAWPSWIYIKFVVWLSLGLITAVMLRKPKWNKWLSIATIALVATAAYAAIFKP